jgi:hypothetical protein
MMCMIETKSLVLTALNIVSFCNYSASFSWLGCHSSFQPQASWNKKKDKQNNFFCTLHTSTVLALFLQGQMEVNSHMDTKMTCK